MQLQYALGENNDLLKHGGCNLKIGCDDGVVDDGVVALRWKTKFIEFWSVESFVRKQDISLPEQP